MKECYEEQTLIAAAAQYAQAKGIPLTKMSWMLGSIMKVAENSLLNKLREATGNLRDDQSLEGIRKRLQTNAENDVVAQEDLEKRLGEVVTVKVLSIRTYGAVCQVEGTTRTLLLHLSEIANAFIHDVSEYLKPGDRFPAMLIVNVAGNLGLSTRRYKPLRKKRRRGVGDTEQLYLDHYGRLDDV